MRTKMIHFSSILLSIMLIFSFGGIAFGAPSVSSTSGSVTNGQSVTISGSNFGTKSPAAPAFYDNGLLYTGLSNGSVIPTPESGGTNPYGWDGFSGGSANPVYYKTSNPRGVWAAHYSNQWSPNGYLQSAMGDGGVAIAGASASKQLYVTWWMYLSGDPTIGGTNSANKYCRLMSGVGAWGSAGQGTIIWEPNESFFSYGFTCGYLPGENYASPTAKYPAWNRMEMWIDSTGSNAPNYSCGVNGAQSSTYTSTPSQGWVINTLSSLGADWDNSSGEPVMDWGEIYADNTYSRVEACSGSTWASRGHCEIQIPSAWSASSVTATVNQGSFSNGATAYLYVLDSTNTANSSGYPITFGSGSTPPPAPGQPFLQSSN